MNAENFSRFLTSYAQLYHLSYVELESLVLEYPYSQNLHLLLFAKSWLEQHPQADANLRTAALYSTDRRVLYTFMQELSKHLAAPSIQFSMQEDYLELTELPRLPKLQELPAPEPVNIPLFENPNTDLPERAPTIQPRRKAAPPPAPDKAAVREKLSQLFRLDEPEEAPPSKHSDKTVVPESPAVTPGGSYAEILRKILSRRLEERDLSPARTSKPAEIPATLREPMPKSAFSSWKRQFTAGYVQERLEALRKSLLLPQDQAPDDPAEAIVHASIRENQDLATETLAEIFLRQGQKDKALQVYERLILIFPEKTAFFAAKIENIKNSGQ